jgi:hypothetical protein
MVRLKPSAALGAGLALGLAASAGLAHTTIQPPTAREGERAEHAVKIGHGCGEQPVVAQSVVFPGAPAVLAALAAVGPGAGPAVALEPGSLLGQLELVAQASGALRQELRGGAGEAATGFVSRPGPGQRALGERVPFAFRAPRFAAQSCVRRLIVQVAVADLCEASPPWATQEKLGLWIPDNGSRYAREGRAGAVGGIGMPARLVVERDPGSNPLAESCGEGVELTLTPSAEQLDRELGIPGFWPPADGG